MASTDELRNMIYSFRVSELQDLLGYAGRNKTGKKQELQGRALDLLKLRSPPVQMKVIELHKRRFHVMSMAPPSSHVPPEVPLKVPVPALRSSQVVPPHSMPPRSNVMNNLNYNSSNPYTVQTKTLPLTAPSQVSNAAYPIHPDVKLKNLPFYDVLHTLLQPSSLSPSGNGSFQENHFQFSLSPGQVNQIAMSRDYSSISNPNEYGVQIQLRFCLLEVSCEQEDNFPPSICVKVNNKLCQLPNPIPTNRPGMEPKRPSRPVNITPLCKLSAVSANNIIVSWTSEYNRAYTISVYLVRRLDSATLLSRLRSKGMRNPDHTRAMIKEKLEQGPDSEIATTSLRGSLICPIGKMKMQMPCRPMTCTHLQCFDANLFLKMNEKKPRWICPVCDKPATFSSLSIDGLFSEISAKAPSNCTEVQFHEDGSWTPVKNEKETHDISDISVGTPVKKQLKRKSEVEVIDLTCDSDTDEDLFSPNMFAKKAGPTFQSSSALAMPPLIYPPTTKTASVPPFISLSSPSSPSVLAPFENLSGAGTPTIPAPPKTPSPSSMPYPISDTLPPLKPAPTGKDNSVPSCSSMLGSSIYSSNLSYMEPPYYESTISSPPPGREMTTTSQGYIGETDFDLFSLLRQGTQDIAPLPGLSTPRKNTSSPDVISLD